MTSFCHTMLCEAWQIMPAHLPGFLTSLFEPSFGEPMTERGNRSVFVISHRPS